MRSFKQYTAGFLSNQKFNKRTSEELASIRSEISFNYLIVSLQNDELLNRRRVHPLNYNQQQ